MTKKNMPLGALSSFSGKSKGLSDRAKAILAAKVREEEFNRKMALNDAGDTHGASNAEADAYHGTPLPEAGSLPRLTRRVAVPAYVGPSVVLSSNLSVKHPLTNKRLMGKNTPSKQAVNTRIAALTANIHELLAEIAHCVKLGQMDNAGKKCDKVSRSRAQLIELTAVYNEYLALEAKAEGEAEQRKRALAARKGGKVQIKRRVYKRWSDNPTKK